MAGPLSEGTRRRGLRKSEDVVVVVEDRVVTEDAVNSVWILSSAKSKSRGSAEARSRDMFPAR